MYKNYERYEDKMPRADRAEQGDRLVNDTGATLERGDVVYIDPANATSGVSKVITNGSASWRFRASNMAAAGQKAGKLRVVTKGGAPGAEVLVVGREPTLTEVKVLAAQDSTLAPGASLCAQNATRKAASDLSSGYTGSRIFARTAVEHTFTGVTEALVLCEVDGERGFGVN